MYSPQPDLENTEPTEDELENDALEDDELRKMYELEEKMLANDGMLWSHEPDEFDDFIDVSSKLKLVQKIPAISPSQFTEFAFRMPRNDGLGYENFTFDGRRHMKRPYNTPTKRMLLFCGRQVEKSTLLGNIILTYSCVVPAYKTLYVSPSATQTKTFSADRIKEPIETSPVLRAYTANMLSQNILEKQLDRKSVV
jgi:hypothetical protein